MTPCNFSSLFFIVNNATIGDLADNFFQTSGTKRPPLASVIIVASVVRIRTMSSLADWLVMACKYGDLSTAKTAVEAGASVSEQGWTAGCTWLPLTAAVAYKYLDVVAWLLSLGADPNGDGVMFYAAWMSSPDILQLLIDAGGDVNWASAGGPLPPLVTVLSVRRSPNEREDCVRVLLTQPSLDLLFTYEGKLPELYARDNGDLALADMIAREVSRAQGHDVGLADLGKVGFGQCVGRLSCHQTACHCE